MAKGLPFGLGLDRPGFISLAHPLVALGLVVVACALVGLAATQLRYSSEIRQIYQTDTPQYQALERMSAQYATGDREVFLTVESDDLFTRERLATLRDLHLELAFVDGVADVLSPYSARTPPDSTGATTPLFPADLASAIDLERLREQAVAHPFIANRLLSSDGRVALFVIALTETDRDLGELGEALDRIRTTSDDFLESHGDSLKAHVTGIPAMRIAIIGALQRDQIMFSVAGALVGMVLSLLFFGSVRHVVIVAVPAFVATAWSFLAILVTGGTVNFLNNVTPVLALILAFADGVHMLYAIERKRGEGLDVEGAIASAVRNIAPACVLTSLTTATALVSLTLVPEKLVSDFAAGAAIAILLAYLAMIITLPALARLVLKHSPAGRRTGLARRLHAACTALSKWAARLASIHGHLLVGAGIAVLAIAGTLYLLNTPTYRYQSTLPRTNEAYRGMHAIDTHLAGSNRLRVLVELPQGWDVLSSRTLDVLADVEAAIRAQPQFASPFSLATVERWWRNDRQPREAFLDEQTVMRNPLLSLMVSETQNSALVTAQYSDTESADLLPALDALDADLAEIEARHLGVSLQITGIGPVSARAGHAMVARLSLSLLGAIATVILLIALTFRSLGYALLSVLPNVVPITLAGALLYLLGDGLRLTSVVAFTIAFGIAVDDTIHVLNAYRLKRASGKGNAVAVRRAITTTGPILIVSTFVLAAGMASLMLSEMQALQVYSWVSIVILFSALVCDLLVLPATLLLLPDKGRPSSLHDRTGALAHNASESR